MTADHRASDPAESRRIRSLGGEIHAAVSTDDSARVAGELEVTRSFGDAALKYCIKADPDYQEHSLATDGDEFLILATDGVWDVVSDATAVKLVSEHVRACRRDMPPAEVIARRAYRDRGMDDIGVLVVLLQQQHTWKPEQRRAAERAALLTSTSSTGSLRGSDVQ